MKLLGCGRKRAALIKCVELFQQMDIYHKNHLVSVCIFVIADSDIGIVHFFAGAVKFNHQETQKHKQKL